MRASGTSTTPQVLAFHVQGAVGLAIAPRELAVEAGRPSPTASGPKAPAPWRRSVASSDSPRSARFTWYTSICASRSCSVPLIEGAPSVPPMFTFVAEPAAGAVDAAHVDVEQAQARGG